MYKLLTVTNNAGGVTPNLAKEIICDALGKQWEAYEGEWADIPIVVAKNKAASGMGNMSEITAQLTSQIEKAQQKNESEEIVVVMKEVRRLLRKMQGVKDEA